MALKFERYRPRPGLSFAVLSVVVMATACHPSIPAVTPTRGQVNSDLINHSRVSIVFDPPVKGATALQGAKLERARVLAEAAINEPKFRERVLLFSSTLYSGAQGDGYRQAERAQPAPHAVLSSEEVLGALLDGNGIDGQIHIPIDVTTLGTSRDGFAETPYLEPGGVTSIFPDWLNGSTTTDVMVAETLIHEHMHRLGFEHEHSRSTGRCGSIPYAVGKLACAVSAGDSSCIPDGRAKC